jgi:hypothetical protein
MKETKPTGSEQRYEPVSRTVYLAAYSGALNALVARDAPDTVGLAETWARYVDAAWASGASTTTTVESLERNSHALWLERAPNDLAIGDDAVRLVRALRGSA